MVRLMGSIGDLRVRILLHSCLSVVLSNPPLGIDRVPNIRGVLALWVERAEQVAEVRFLGHDPSSSK